MEMEEEKADYSAQYYFVAGAVGIKGICFLRKVFLSLCLEMKDFWKGIFFSVV